MESSVRIEETAAAYLAKRDSGEWSEADQAELNGWLQASTAHRVAFLRLEAAWQQALRLKALGAAAKPGVASPPHRWRLPLTALAASIALLFALGIGWYLWPHGSSYQTAVGGLALVPLPDGSKVTLNTDSEIRIAVTRSERRVDLQQGEAFFEVAPDPARPFVVTAGDRRIIAVGTRFSVHRAADGVRVVVTEGRVRVERRGGGKQEPATQLFAGTIARSNDAGTLVQEKPLRQTEEYLSWRSGFIVFRDTALAEASAEFNRYNTRKIVIEDPAVAQIRIGGSFRATNLDAFVRLLEGGFPIRAERRGEQIVLTGG